MSDDALSLPLSGMGRSNRRPAQLMDAPRELVRSRVDKDKARISQKRRIPIMRARMKEALGSAETSPPEVNWISELVAELPTVRWTVEHIERGTWYFKLQLPGDIRVNLQVDEDDDAFASVYCERESVGMIHGSLRQLIADLTRFAAAR